MGEQFNLFKTEAQLSELWQLDSSNLIFDIVDSPQTVAKSAGMTE
jgi:hypothetical protein